MATYLAACALALFSKAGIVFLVGHHVIHTDVVIYLFIY
jgi:hypothetical protein